MIKKILVFVALMSYTVFMSAQSVPYLSISQDPRSLSLGGSGVALNADSYSFLNNVSSSVFSDNKGAVSTSYTGWMPNGTNLTFVGLSGFYKLGSKFAVAFMGRHIGYKEYTITDISGNDNGKYKPSDIHAGFGLAYKIASNFSTSLSLHMVSSSMSENVRVSALAADLGLTYSSRNYNIGLKVANIGSKLDYGNGPYSLPANLNAGFAYKKEINSKNAITTALNAGYIFSSSGFMAGLGVEYWYNKIVALRLGGHYGDTAKSVPSYASVGVGLCLKGITLDAAYLISSKDTPIGSTISLGLGYKF